MNRKLGVYAALVAITSLMVINVSSYAQGKQSPYRLLSVRNDTGESIAYKISFGGDKWQSWTVKAGKQNKHWWNVKENGPCPTIFIKYDNRAGTTVKKVLEAYKSTNVAPGAQGKRYYFDYDENGKRLLIFNEN